MPMIAENISVVEINTGEILTDMAETAKKDRGSYTRRRAKSG